MDKQKEILLQDPQDILASSLVQDEVETLSMIRGQLNDNIIWKKVVAEVLPAMLDSMEHTLTISDLAKQVPLEALPLEFRKFIGDNTPHGELRKRYIMLHLVKKLLLALKNKVVNDIRNIPILDYDEESELEELLEAELSEEDTEERSSSGGNEDSCLHLHTRTDRTTVLGGSADGRNWHENTTYCADCGKFLYKTPMTIEKQTEIDADISDLPCQHVSTKTSRVLITGRSGRGKDREIVTKCTECRKILSRKIDYQPPLSRKDDSPCQHESKVHWKLGEEGKVAACGLCGEDIKDPQDYTWEAAGLEPYGDNPDADEVITL